MSNTYPGGSNRYPSSGQSSGGGATSLVVNSDDDTIIQNGSSTFDPDTQTLTVDLSAIDNDVLNKVLTGLTADEGRIVDTDTILEAFSRLSHAPTFTAVRISSNGDTIILGTPPNTISLNIAAMIGTNKVTFPGGNVTSTSVIGIDPPPAANTLVSYIGPDGIQSTRTIIGNQGIAIDDTTPGQLKVSNYKGPGKLIDVDYTLALADGNYIQIGVPGITITLPLISDILADPKWGPYSEITFTNLSDVPISSIAPQGPNFINGAFDPIDIVGSFNTTTFYVDPVYEWLIK